MKPPLFDLNLDNWMAIILTLLPAAINFGIFFYVISFLGNNRTNTAFAVFVLLLGFWQTGEGFTRMSSTDLSAINWYRMCGFPALFMLPFGMLFALRFTGYGKKVRPVLIHTLLFIPAIILEMYFIAGGGKYNVTQSELWNWIIKPEMNVMNWIAYIWMSLISLLMVGIFWHCYIHSSLKVMKTKRSQILLVAIGFSIPTVGGIAAEVIPTLFTSADPIPISTTSMTAFSVLSFIGMIKYNFSDYSPKHQWGSIIETMNEGVLIVDNLDRIMYVNKKFCEVMGYKRAELIGKVANEYFSEDSFHKKLIESAIIERNKEVSGNYEIQLRNKAGEKVWMLISGFPYLDKNGRVIGAIGIHTNINHIKQTTVKLEEKVSELRHFFYKAHHDLKTPATTIQGLVNLYKDKKENSAEHLLFLIEKCNYQLLMLIDNISRVEAIMSYNPTVKEIDLDNKIKTIIKYITPEDKRVEFKVSFTLDSKIHSDKELLNIILRNLLDNATKYSDPSKPVCVTEIACEKKNGHVEIRISDNGQGIPDIVQDKVFNMFFKGNRSSGIGLGLYMAKCAVEKLGGSIAMKSKEHFGTEFTICLPTLN